MPSSPRGTPLPDRIRALVEYDPFGGCWLWAGAIGKFPDGSPPRGRMEVAGRRLLAHRASYVAFKGEIPNGLAVCHHCDVSLCVNPDHLYAGTHRQNMADMVRRGRSAAKRNQPRGAARHTGVYATRMPHLPWCATIRVGGSPGRIIYLGGYPTQDEASIAFEAARAVRDAIQKPDEPRNIDVPGKDSRAAIDALAELLLAANPLTLAAE